jgi:hypothetical protein
MNTGLAAVIVAVAIVGIIAGLVVPIVRSRGRTVGWDAREPEVTAAEPGDPPRPPRRSQSRSPSA